MEKHLACRAAIEAANPELKRDPDRLKVFIDQGRLVARRTAGLGYEWRYRLKLFLDAWGGAPDAIMAPLLLWIRDNQPELMLNFDKEDTAIRFQADILDSRSADILIEFELSESVALTPRDGGGYDVTHLPEPSAADPLIDPVAAALDQVWLGDQRLI